MGSSWYIININRSVRLFIHIKSILFQEAILFQQRIPSSVATRPGICWIRLKQETVARVSSFRIQSSGASDFTVKLWLRNLSLSLQSSVLWPSWLFWFVRRRRTSQHSKIPASETTAQIYKSEKGESEAWTLRSLKSLLLEAQMKRLTLCRKLLAPL